MPWNFNQVVIFVKSVRRCTELDKLLFGRGIDIEKVNIVINYDMPDQADQYLHRVGRAGRFGTRGLAVSFVTPDADENTILEQVQSHFEVKIDELPDQIDTNDYMFFTMPHCKERQTVALALACMMRQVECGDACNHAIFLQEEDEPDHPELCLQLSRILLPLTGDLILPGNEYVALMLLTSTTELLKATDLLESMGRQHRISNITIDMLYIANGQTDWSSNTRLK